MHRESFHGKYEKIKSERIPLAGSYTVAGPGFHGGGGNPQGGGANLYFAKLYLKTKEIKPGGRAHVPGVP